MKTATTSRPKIAKIEKTTNTFTRYGHVCGRTEFTALDAEGNEIGFAWAEEVSRPAGTPTWWGAFRWSNLVGPVGIDWPVGIDSPILSNREQAEAAAENHLRRTLG